MTKLHLLKDGCYVWNGCILAANRKHAEKPESLTHCYQLSCFVEERPAWWAGGRSLAKVYPESRWRYTKVWKGGLNSCNKKQDWESVIGWFYQHSLWQGHLQKWRCEGPGEALCFYSERHKVWTDRNVTGKTMWPQGNAREGTPLRFLASATFLSPGPGQDPLRMKVLWTTIRQRRSEHFFWLSPTQNMEVFIFRFYGGLWERRIQTSGFWGFCFFF